MAYTQNERLIAIDTPMGKDALLLQRMSGVEGLSRLFRFDLELLSDDDGHTANALIGQRVTIALRLQDGTPRFINGFVSRFVLDDTDARLTRYRMEVVPWLWFLTRTTDCRIFQSKSVPQIIEQIFKDLKFTDYKLQLQGSFPALDYCVQYRETDFAFVSRLMEQYGIFYFFEHAEKKHTLVLANTATAHAACPKQPKARCEATGTMHQEDVVSAWRMEYELRPGKYTLNDFHFETPTTRLLAGVESTQRVSGGVKYEVYDYPGEYTTKSSGEERARLRMQEEDVAGAVAGGASTCRGFVSGYRFELQGHDRRDFNGAYVLTEVQHYASAGSAYGSGDRAALVDETYRNRFTCIPHAVPYRPPRRTPRPIIPSAQTAIVVGPKGEEIHTDKYGRVRVQFHWDREGKYDEKSSCWIRVSQEWAGKRWGAMFLPRIGQEVIVKFLEGDPDQPIIVGRVYNAEHMPPYGLAAEQTKSTIKTYSSKGGGGFNEIRFEDQKDKEQVFMHAERQQDTRVKQDSLEWVGQDRHLIVTGDQLEQVKRDKHLRVHGDHHEQVDGTVSLKIGMDLDEKVGMKAAVDAGMEVHLKAGMNVVIEGGLMVTLKAGSNFVTVGPTGVAISGMPILINSGGAAGAGSGASVEAPKKPKEADVATPGESAAVPAPLTVSPQAVALRQAAREGRPFCEKCAEAARQAALARGATPAEAESIASEFAPQRAAEDAGPAARPAEQAAKTFVAIELVNEQGKPVPGARYRIAPPRGAPVEGVLDAEGKARVDGIDAGTCKVSFPDFDGREWKRG